MHLVTEENKEKSQPREQEFSWRFEHTKLEWYPLNSNIKWKQVKVKENML